MVVGLVLEEEQPILVLPVHVDGGANGAGVDLFGLVQSPQNPLLLQVSGTDGAHIHQAETAVLAVQVLSEGQIPVEGLADYLVVDFDIGQVGAERGVAAMIGPICVDYFQLGQGRVPVLLPVVVLTEADIVQIHRQVLTGHQIVQGLLVKVSETGQDGHLFRAARIHL